jgi:hypothetical protein
LPREWFHRPKEWRRRYWKNLSDIPGNKKDDCMIM